MRREEDFAPLIDVNRIMMQGLAGQVDGPAE
jgi:flagellar biosynthesis regulator FlaF